MRVDHDKFAAALAGDQVRTVSACRAAAVKRCTTAQKSDGFPVKYTDCSITSTFLESTEGKDTVVRARKQVPTLPGPAALFLTATVHLGHARNLLSERGRRQDTGPPSAAHG